MTSITKVNPIFNTSTSSSNSSASGADGKDPKDMDISELRTEISQNNSEAQKFALSQILSSGKRLLAELIGATESDIETKAELLDTTSLRELITLLTLSNVEPNLTAQMQIDLLSTVSKKDLQILLMDKYAYAALLRFFPEAECQAKIEMANLRHKTVRSNGELAEALLAEKEVTLIEDLTDEEKMRQITTLPVNGVITQAEEIHGYMLRGNRVIANSEYQIGNYYNNALVRGIRNFRNGESWVGFFQTNGQITEGKIIRLIGNSSNFLNSLEGKFKDGYLIEGTISYSNKNIDQEFILSGTFQNQGRFLVKGTVTYPDGNMNAVNQSEQAVDVDYFFLQ